MIRKLNSNESHLPRQRLCARVAVWCLGFVATVGACDGDKDAEVNRDNDSLVAFTASACKDGAELDESLPAVLPLLTMTDSTSYEGLNCVSWRHDGQSTLDVDLINFTSGCIHSWNGQATVAEGNRVHLSVENPSCDISACGNCIYDWSFAVDRIPAGQDAVIDIEVWTFPKAGCDMSDPTDSYTETVSIDAGSLAEGTVCRYANPNTLEWLSKTGSLFEPCADACDTGLECAPHPDTEEYADQSLCLLPCTEGETTCPHPDLTACIDGFCQLENVW